LFFLTADRAAEEGKQQEPFGEGTKEMNSHEIAEHATKALSVSGFERARQFFDRSADAVSRGLSVPVWLVLDDEQLYLLPVYGSDTQWYERLRSFVSSQQGFGA
jgi:hypothetical protein